ncbi:aldehyde dehydrogenase family protein [Marisediminicola sp. UYEF4]|uniref:aldehyde dehydrogenase family protein n=1 Tax=Marisediminicola sp. UYEF4 TaxID=1756384 RepID=UPI00339515D9
MHQGSALDWSTDVGSLTDRAQFQRTQAHVDDAIARGASVLAGGAARSDLGPLFFAPTVLAGVTEEMLCAREETFGPLVASPSPTRWPSRSSRPTPGTTG